MSPLSEPSRVGPHFEALLQRVHRLHDLNAATRLLAWDREVNMPRSATSDRAQQMATLAQVTHELLVDERTGTLLAGAESELPGAEDPGGLAAALLRELRRQYDEAVKLPAEFVARKTRVTVEIHRIWVEARARSDWALFAPQLERAVALARENAALLSGGGEPYDALLDRYEPGAKAAELEVLFEATARALVPLRQAIDERSQRPRDALLRQRYPIEAQQAFAREIAAVVGYDFERGHLGTAVHPFASSTSRNDCRITARWREDFLGASLFSTLHECGHAIYEQNTAPELARTPLARGTSAGIHESQSRMMENLVGRSLPFWRAHLWRLQRHFPAQLEGVDPETFWKAVNVVRPSLIRVEADELTYNLHILLRFQLERALLSGALAAREAREAWNEGMRSLLGIVPDNDAQGILQDMHWAGGLFGYFPTYTIGNLAAAQLFEAALGTGGVADGLSRGETAPLLSWLREHVHRHGSVYPPRELMVRATDRPLDEAAFVRYAREKFTAVYGL